MCRTVRSLVHSKQQIVGMYQQFLNDWNQTKFTRTFQIRQPYEIVPSHIMKSEMKISSKLLVFRAFFSIFSFSVLNNYLCSRGGSSTHSKEQNSIIICLTFFTEIFFEDYIREHVNISKSFRGVGQLILFQLCD